MKILLDTNIAIKLEDPLPVDPQLASFYRLCQQHGLTFYVSDANFADIKRDQNIERRQLTLSKLGKFPRLQDVAIDPEDELAARFGQIKNANDHCDIQLLGILYRRAADLLISEDEYLRKRAENAGLGGRVLNIADALEFIYRTYEPRPVALPYIEDVPAYQIDINDSFFDSLREDYSEFNTWFQEKCVKDHRPCWRVTLDGKLAGLVIRKLESPEEADCTVKADKILKISTFKMAPDFQGEKFGEQLLKQILWWSKSNNVGVVYLTAFSKQDILINLLETYGFHKTKTLTDGELVLEKEMMPGPLSDTNYQQNPISYNRERYPRYYDGPKAPKFVVPIHPEYYEVLFPEAVEKRQPTLFDGISTGENLTPGNTIKKIYICRSMTNMLGAGAIILFYVTKNDNYLNSQSICTIGVIEQIAKATSLNELLVLTAKRSVYSLQQLEEQMNSDQKPIKVIDFLLNVHLERPVRLSTLLQHSVLNGPPQSITSMPENRYQKLKSLSGES